MDSTQDKLDFANTLIRWSSQEKLDKLNRKYKSNYTKDDLYISDKIDVPKETETFCLHVTDLHYGKKTHSYSISVCNVRIHRLINRLQKIYDIERKSRNFESFTIFDTGDMIDGVGIYPTQMAGHLDESSGRKQAQGVVTDFYNPLIEWGLKRFPKVRICKVPGNHGRIGWQVAEKDNWDCVVTDNLNMVWSRELNVSIQGGSEFFRVFDIGNHKIALFHGAYNSHRNNLGLPYYKLGETASMWNQTSPFDALFIGHYHQMAMIPLKIGQENQRVYLGGTMATGDDYSVINYGRDGMHSWWLFGLHESRKSPSFQYQLDLL